ncbi:TetR/AcrR family transcriptional regulator [Microlunatus spumicola]|uniref:TetR/AcrR family transcriptional regulator n=1 Tax=Microlunatus spumicola TaxID=81499 RepID=A0ABP6Y2X1_9ACTN
MVANPERAARLADAGLEVLAASGTRGLTHRAVDRAAGEPAGTTSNYFRTRAALLGALADRVFERLQPVATPPGQAPPPPDVDAYVAAVTDVVARVVAQPALWLALVELRLEATRSPELGPRLHRTLSRGFADDLAHHRAAGLPGGDLSVRLLHHAVDGLLLDLLTPSIGARTDTDAVVRALVERLSGPAR